jgi:hypothetical protein
VFEVILLHLSKTNTFYSTHALKICHKTSFYTFNWLCTNLV